MSRLDPPSESPPTLPERLEHLRQRHTERLDRTRRKHKIQLGLSLLTTVLVLVALVTLTGQAFQLDASAVAQIGRLELEKHLPDSRARVATHLESEAPAVVEQALRSLLDMLPKLRSILLQEMDARLSRITAEGEEELRRHMESSIRSSKERLDHQFPDKDDAWKLEQLVTAVTHDFENNMDIVFDELYPQYVSEIDRVYSFLTHLNEYDDDRLTEKERVQKELIRTLLRLMILEEEN